MAGPLAGLRIVEFAGIGPAPFAGMMLADHGAEVIRIDRPEGPRLGAAMAARDPLGRSRRSIAIDLKSPDGIAIARRLCGSADGLIEGFRPGVMERLGLGPDVLLADRPALVYGRMTGWGQTGPYAQAAGHDINYIALAGTLYHLGRAGEKPAVPINLVGDFGGGGMLLAFAMTSAMLAVARGAAGQVIDCAMTEGAGLLGAMVQGFRSMGRWSDARGTNLLDGGAPFYDSYRCADGEYLAVGAIEPEFYAALRKTAGLADDPAFDAQLDPARWPGQKNRLAALFATRSRDEWCAVFAGGDACVAPILSLAEAPDHPHARARGSFVSVGGDIQPAPAPRFSRDAADAPRVPPPHGADTDAVLDAIGYDGDARAALRAAGTIA